MVVFSYLYEPKLHNNSQACAEACLRGSSRSYRVDIINHHMLLKDKEAKEDLFLNGHIVSGFLINKINFPMAPHSVN